VVSNGSDGRYMGQRLRTSIGDTMLEELPA
jgi:hypothetical protein